MRRRWPSALLATLLVVSAVPVIAAEPAATSERSDLTTPAFEPSPGSVPDAAGRFIVILKPGVDAKKVRENHAKKDGVRPDRVFDVVRAYSAKLNPRQRAALLGDPAVAAVVADEVIQLASQSIPTGIKRIGARSSIALGTSGGAGVDADIAIVDTGIDRTQPDLNVQGGINCSTSTTTDWRDVHGHGTHVAGIAAAKDDDFGVVGVAPGARLWAVKILNDSGYGLLSWYVCGLDWIAAQRDEGDPGRQMIEVVNMSVAKSGADDRNCGLTSSDILHQAICRLTATGVTVIAAAANESRDAYRYVPAAYDEVITVSALADTDGKPGGLGPSSVCGSANRDDTFAIFSNYGADIDIMAPGKCIRSTLPGSTTGLMSGTSMAAPHVAGAVALYKATRPWATTAETLAALLALGSMDWDTTTDPDGVPDVLLDVSRLGPYGDFAMAFGRSTTTAPPGGSATIPVIVNRSTTHIERVTLSTSGPAGYELALNAGSLFGTNGVLATLSVAIPEVASHGSYTLTVTGTEHGRERQATTELVVAPQATTGARFTAIAPVRVLDTRTGAGLSGTFRSSVVRHFQIAGRDGIPTDAVAVSGNLTVVGQTSAGYLSLGPTVSSTPSTSVLNVPIGDVRATGVTVALSPDGTLGAVWKGATNSTTHLIFDATGYFLEGSDGLTFRALPPARVLDTRIGNGLGGAFRSAVPRVVQVSGRSSIPPDAIAITANLTIANQSSHGYVSVGPAMTARPSTSTLNAPKGDVRANGVTVLLSEDGGLGLVWMGGTGSTAHLILDVTGYFTTSSSGAMFHPVTPARIVDSRTRTGLDGMLATAAPRAFTSAGLGPIPGDAIAVTATLTITGQTSRGYLSVGPIMSSNPGTSTLNAPVGDNRANGMVNLVGPAVTLGIVWMGSSGSRTHAIVDVTGYYR